MPQIAFLLRRSRLTSGSIGDDAATICRWDNRQNLTCPYHPLCGFAQVGFAGELPAFQVHTTFRLLGDELVGPSSIRRLIMNFRSALGGSILGYIALGTAFASQERADIPPDAQIMPSTGNRPLSKQHNQAKSLKNGAA